MHSFPYTTSPSKVTPARPMGNVVASSAPTHRCKSIVVGVAWRHHAWNYNRVSCYADICTSTALRRSKHPRVSEADAGNETRGPAATRLRVSFPHVWVSKLSRPCCFLYYLCGRSQHPTNHGNTPCYHESTNDMRTKRTSKQSPPLGLGGGPGAPPNGGQDLASSSTYWQQKQATVQSRF